MESVSDAQKYRFRSRTSDKSAICDKGFFNWSRHPNYFGEITLWAGLAVVSGGFLASSAGQKALGWSGSPAARLGACLMVAASPAFSAFLLIKLSGVPLSEKKYDKKFGDRKEYQQWKENTPMIIPKLW